MPLAGETYECPRCGAEVMWCYGEGMRLRHQPGYWLDGDGIGRHRCDPATVQAKRIADQASRQPPATDDYMPAGAPSAEPGQPARNRDSAPPPPMRPARPALRAPSGDVEV